LTFKEVSLSKRIVNNDDLIAQIAKWETISHWFGLLVLLGIAGEVVLGFQLQSWNKQLQSA
jgi:hypothetical protein